MASIGKNDDDDENENRQQQREQNLQSRPAPQRVVRRPHRMEQGSSATPPLGLQQPRNMLEHTSRPLRPEEIVTDRLQPPAPLKRVKPRSHIPHIKDRNAQHTIYDLYSHAHTQVHGYVAVEADITREGDVMLVLVDVGGQWRSVPFYLNHELIQQLFAADRDAEQFYGPFDDDEGA